MAPQLGELARGAPAHHHALVGGDGAFGLDLAGRVPERPQERHLARVVPDAGRHDAARPRHAGHLTHARFRIAHEVHDELREGGVEHPVGERELLGRRHDHLNAGQPCPARLRERRRRLRGGDGGAPEPLREHPRERPRPAADVEGPHALVDTGERCQGRGQLPAVATDVAVVCIRGYEERLGAWHRGRRLPARLRLRPGIGQEFAGGERRRRGRWKRRADDGRRGYRERRGDDSRRLRRACGARAAALPARRSRPPAPGRDPAPAALPLAPRPRLTGRRPADLPVLWRGHRLRRRGCLFRAPSTPSRDDEKAGGEERGEHTQVAPSDPAPERPRAACPPPVHAH